MSSQDAAFLPSWASFCAIFLENCGRDDSLWTTTCLTSVVLGCKAMLPVVCFCSRKTPFVSMKFHGDHKTACCCCLLLLATLHVVGV